MNMIHEVPPDLFYTDPGFLHPENVYTLSEKNCSSSYFVHVDTLAMGEFPHFKNLNWAGFWQDTQQPGQPFRGAVTSSLILEENRFDA
jgi:hypothetical protein